jgi:hypothetical protein
MQLWIGLMAEHHERLERAELDVADRLVDFAKWCIYESGPVPNETSSAAAVTFLEDLPTRKALWPHFRRWFTPEEFNDLEPQFSYLLPALEFGQLRLEYQSGVRKEKG